MKKQMEDNKYISGKELLEAMKSCITEEKRAALYAGGEGLYINEPNRKTMLRMLETDENEITGTVEAASAAAMVRMISDYLEQYMADHPEAHIWIILACVFSAFIAAEPLHPQETARWKKDEDTGTYRCRFREEGPESTCRWCVCRLDRSSYTIGIDIGTTTISGVVYDPENRMALRSLTVQNPGNLQSAETFARMQDPESVCRTAEEMLETLAGWAEKKEYGRPAAIGLSGQMHGILYTDSDGCAVSPLYTWQDSRGDVTDKDGWSAVSLAKETCSAPAAAGYGWITHLYNMRHGLVPDDASKICSAADYFGMRLTGRKTPLLHDSIAASFGFWDIYENRFEQPAMEKLGIDGSLIPETSSGMEILGEWQGIPVCTALGDSQAAFLGTAGQEKDVLLLNMGTGGQACMLSDTVCAEDAVETRPFLDGQYLLAGASLCGGRAYAVLERFFREYVAAAAGKEESQYALMEKLADEAEKGGSGCPLQTETLFAGTRTDPKRRGSITGLSEDNFQPGFFIRSVMEGMVRELYEMYLAMGIPAKRAVCSGNGFRKNKTLIRIAGEITNLPVSLSPCEEEAACGAAEAANRRAFMEKKADSIYYHGKIAVMDAEGHFCSAMAVSGGKILKTGTDEEILALKTEDTVLTDLEGRLVLPGMHDSHVHLADYIHNTFHLACDHFLSVKEVQEGLAGYAKKNPEGWLLGNGLSQDAADDGLNRLSLDEVVPDRPVILVMWHGHGCIANTEALKRSGIDRNTANPVGSVIEHFDDGTPSGVLQEAGALQLVFAGMPSFTPEEIADKLEKGQLLMNSMGYTGYTECTAGPANNGREGGASGENCLKAYQILLKEKRMTCRTAVGFYSGRAGVQSPEWLAEDLEEGKVPPAEDEDWLSFHMLKFFCDGVEVAHTAWLKEDYLDAPGNHGISCFAAGGRSDEEQAEILRKILKTAHDSGYQIGIHTVGNRAVKEAVDAIIAAQKENPRENCRHCIIHADGMGDFEDLVRAKENGIIVSSQPGLLADAYEKGCELVGEEKGLGLMPLRSLTDAGVILCGGSDSIAGDYHDWRASFHQAVTKRSSVTGNVYHPEERISLFEVLRMYTYNGAYQEFAEEKRGTLEEGKFADFIVLDKDLFSLDPEDYLTVKVLRTVVDGRTVWEA